jgi:hypothetical protein
MKTGIELISEERKEQLEKHGWTPEHDDEVNSGGQLTQAAMYALTLDEEWYPKTWGDWFKIKVTHKPRIERNIIAGALLAADIDREQRQK